MLNFPPAHQPVACGSFQIPSTNATVDTVNTCNYTHKVTESTLIPCEVSVLCYWPAQVGTIGQCEIGSHKLINRDEVWHLHFLLDPTFSPPYNNHRMQKGGDSTPDHFVICPLQAHYFLIYINSVIPYLSVVYDVSIYV